MIECLFCKIAAKELPAKIIYEDELVVVFDDIYPKAPLHKLIIPRKHIATINDIEKEDNELIGHMFQVAKKIAKQLNIDESGYRLLFNCNADAGQVVYHIHLHLIGGKKLPWPNA